MNVIIIGAGNVNKDQLIETVERLEKPFMVGADGGMQDLNRISFSEIWIL